MIKRIIPIALLGAVFFGFNACKSGGSFKKLEGGLEYKIAKDAKGDKKPKVGDIVELHIKLSADDSVLAVSRKENNNQPVQLMIQPSQLKGDWTNALTNLTVGDSAVIRMSIDSMRSELTKKGQMIPPFLEKRKNLIYEVVLVSIKSQEQMRQEQEAQASKQMQTDDQLLRDYFTKNNIQPQKTASGLYYLIEQQGSGDTPRPGQSVTVNYTGRTMDGKVFDSNTDPAMGHAEPFSFVIGQGQVIPGWDEGVSLMKKGSKGKLFIPSPLAYGPQSPAPTVPPNSILIFDVEVTKIEDGAPAGQQMPPVQ